MDSGKDSVESAPLIFRGLPAQMSGGNRTAIILEKKDGQVFVDGVRVIGMVCNGSQLTLSMKDKECYIYNETTPFNMTVDRIYKLLKDSKFGQP